MELFLLYVGAAFVGNIIRIKHSLWASNLFFAICWIALGYSSAIALNADLKAGDIDRSTYKGIYGACYFYAIIGGGYLLPVMLGAGKKKLKKENDL